MALWSCSCAHLLFQVEEEDEDGPDGAAFVIDAHLLFKVEEEDEDDTDGAAFATIIPG
jgi:hypothetical protein